MSLLDVLRNLWQSIAPRRPGDVEEELRSHQQAYAEDLMRHGLGPEEARRKARIDLGQPARQNETYRAAIGLHVFDELSGDIRYGLRALRRNPGFAAIAILSLALGIGATTAMFSVIYAALLHPFPYADADRIMNPVIINEQTPDEYQWFVLTGPQFEAVRQAAPVQNLLGFSTDRMEITGGDIPEDVYATYLTENADAFFGVRALLGRDIQPSDAQNGGQPAAVLNYRFWQRHYGGDPHVIGRTLEIDHVLYTIVGVMPRSFAFSDITGVADVYLPISLSPRIPNLPFMYIPWIKLKPHITPAAADAALEPLVRQFAKDNPRIFPEHWRLQLQPIIVPYQQGIGRALVLLLCGVLLLLIIGCANCSILLLARGRASQHELAVRAALGASRWRIVRQLLVEAVVISFTGALLGVAASYWLAQLPLRLSPDSFPQESVIRINLPILVFSVALALLTGLLFGLVPALRLSRPDLARALPANMRGVAVAAPAKRRWSALIAAQVALTLLLMATAGTAIRSFLQLTQFPLGYDPHHVMHVSIVLRHRKATPQSDAIQSRQARAAFIEQLRLKIAALPGVSVAAVGTYVAPPYSDSGQSFDIAGDLHREQPQAHVQLVSPEYFAALRIPLLHGRIWDASENTRGDFVAVVNQAFVKRYSAQADPLDRQIRVPGLVPRHQTYAVSPQSTNWRQIVGVVGDARNDGIDQPVQPAIYLPYTSLMPPNVQFELRTQGDPLTYLQDIRAAIASIAHYQETPNGVFTFDEAIQRDAQYSRQRLFSILFGVFSAMALALALVGIFSLVAYSVAQRTTEFGVRLALGASRAHILWVAARIALVSTAIGVAVGLAVDAFLGKLLAAWMENTFAATGLLSAAALLALSALLACLLPARHATNIPPAEALRYE